MIVAQKVGDWKAAVHDFRTYAKKFKAVSKRAIMQEAHLWANRIKSGIRTQRSAGKAKPPWMPLLPATIERKGGSTKMLIDTGTMLRSIGAEEVKEWTTYFIGVKRGAKSADGEDLVNIAAVHEFGYSFKSGRSGGELIVVPKRSFIEPIFEEFAKVDIEDRILKRYTKLMQRFLKKKISVPAPKER